MNAGKEANEVKHQAVMKVLHCGLATKRKTPCGIKTPQGVFRLGQARWFSSAVGTQPSFHILQDPSAAGLVEDLVAKSVINFDGLVV